MNAECGHSGDAAAYLSDELLPCARAEFETHLDSCPGCRAAVESKRDLLARLRRLPPVDSTRDLPPLVLARLRAEPRRFAPRSPWFRPAAAAALIAFFAGGAFLTSRQKSPPSGAPSATVAAVT